MLDLSILEGVTFGRSQGGLTSLHINNITLIANPHSNHVTSSKRVYTLICHITMHGDSIKFLYNPGHVTL